MKHKCTVIYYVDSARSVTVSVERFSGCHSRERQRQQSGLRLELSGVRFELSGVRFELSGVRFELSGVKLVVSDLN